MELSDRGAKVVLLRQAQLGMPFVFEFIGFHFYFVAWSLFTRLSTDVRGIKVLPPISGAIVLAEAAAF